MTFYQDQLIAMATSLDKSERKVQFYHMHSKRFHRRRRSRASPVLTAISLVNGKPWETVNFDPHKIGIP